MGTDRLGPIIKEAVNKIMSTALGSGYFERCQSFEPRAHPGTGMTFATWGVDIKPIAMESGLDVTSCRVPMLCRIYVDTERDPIDDIDTDVLLASAHMLNAFTEDFGIDGAEIDLLGRHGEPLGTDLGYIPMDSSIFRIADTLVPFIAPDVFDQGV